MNGTTTVWIAETARAWDYAAGMAVIAADTLEEAQELLRHCADPDDYGERWADDLRCDSAHLVASETDVPHDRATNYLVVVRKLTLAEPIPPAVLAVRVRDA